MASVHPETVFVTATGWIEAWRLAVGDEVFSAEGRPTPVARVTRGLPAAAYALRVSGPPIRVSADHDGLLGLPFHGPNPVTTEPRQPVAPKRVAVELPEVDQPLPPWVYGYWRASGVEDTLPVPTEVAERAVAYLTELGMEVGRTSQDRGTVYVQVLDMVPRLDEMDAFDSLGFVLDYRRAGFDQRVELLAGVLDARATFRLGLKHHVVVRSQRLPFNDDVAEVATSLGWRSSSIRESTPFARIHKDYPVMHIRDAELAEARSRRRTKRVAPAYYVHSHNEIEVTEEFVDVRTESGTYLIGRGMVPVRDC